MKFDMGRAWSEATRLLGVNRDVVLIVAGVFFFLPYTALTMAMGDQVAAIEAGAQSGNADPQAAMSALLGFYGTIWWMLLLLMIVQYIGMLGLLALLTDRTRPTVGEALKIGVTCFPSYFAAAILSGLAMAAPFLAPTIAAAAGSVTAAVLLGILALVAALYLFTKFSLSAPVIVVERVLNPLTALGRSWRLTKGNSVRLFLFYFLLMVAVLVIWIVVSIVIGLILALVGPDAALTGNALVAGLLNAAWATLFLAALAAAHRQLAGPSAEAVGETFE